MQLRKGMLVRVIKGNHKGSEGKLLYVFPKENRAIVEGVNMVKRSVRPTQENPSGGFSEKEAPINLSNLMVVQKGQITRIGYKILDDGSKVRVSLRTGQEIEV
ncbi:MAG: 50S ribosomal protein L24 [Candidatus Marinimicrobia bacterium]|jgi:large subunit ribosomal protein L24|nr:50S ribosomal protein L24 [Candidatus Neomarinimicrobiota bacterium]MBI66461.1 50S ribosomal protein L24 [Candidatus Neomarinimicrobiota bacterium]|tara:strand:+ start:164 stop:472 length:309 start_codon:yes stop_codon:yes gene_type:complete